jgi:delta 1-pyrroline-5-carboxylate dehydrogenase
MVKVHVTTTDPVTAWRVRDALAAHPLLGGATAQIHVIATTQGILLDGWALDEQTVQLAVRLACRAAGQRAVQPRLHTCKPGVISHQLPVSSKQWSR